jgi:hypothetical protein
MSIYHQQPSYKETTPVLTANDFRRIALGMKDAIEGAHMGHPDFRVKGRIFATIHPDHKAGMVKLTPEQQEDFIRDYPGTFGPEAGAWGRGGCTRITLEAGDEEPVGEAMTLAWQNIVRGPTARASKPSRARKPPSRSKTRSPRTR